VFWINDNIPYREASKAQRKEGFNEHSRVLALLQKKVLSPDPNFTFDRATLRF